MKKHAIIRVLVVAGVVPFALGAIAAGRPVAFEFQGVGAELFLAAYGGVILAFLAGIHWGQHLDTADGSGGGLLLLSNAITLLAWLAILLERVDVGVSFLLLAGGFVVQLFVDRRLLRSARISNWYFRLRAQVTTVVVVCLLIAAAGVLQVD